MKTTFIYALCEPGTRTVRVFSEEHCKNISKAATGRPSPKKGKPSGLKGRPWSAARRAAHGRVNAGGKK